MNYWDLILTIELRLVSITFAILVLNTELGMSSISGHKRKSFKIKCYTWKNDEHLFQHLLFFNLWFGKKSKLSNISSLLYHSSIYRVAFFFFKQTFLKMKKLTAQVSHFFSSYHRTSLWTVDHISLYAGGNREKTLYTHANWSCVIYWITC